MSATDSTRCTPLRRAKSSRDAGVSPGRDGMLFAEFVVTLTSASRLLKSLALHSLARTPSAPCRPDGSNGQYRRAKPRAGGLAVARSRRLVGSPIPRSLLGPRRRDPPRRPLRLPQARHRRQTRAARLHPLLLPPSRPPDPPFPITPIPHP